MNHLSAAAAGRDRAPALGPGKGGHGLGRATNGPATSPAANRKDIRRMPESLELTVRAKSDQSTPTVRLPAEGDEHDLFLGHWAGSPSVVEWPTAQGFNYDGASRNEMRMKAAFWQWLWSRP